MRSGGRTWKSTFHFGERGSLASAALQGPVMQVWGKEGPSWECTQVETIRGLIWAESSWRSLGENRGWGPHWHNCSKFLLLSDMAVK